MSPFRIGVALLSVTFVLVGRGVWIARPSAQEHRAALESIAGTAPVADTTPVLPREEDYEPPQTDVYGNEVDEAVGDYRVDITGDLYERHSPQTEIARLKPPVS